MLTLHGTHARLLLSASTTEVPRHTGALFMLL